MSDEILNYYKEYHKGGSAYVLSAWKESSRPKMIINWLNENLKPGDSVLDIGCGDGSYSQWAPEYKWTGIDINEQTEGYNGTRIVADIEKFPYDIPANGFNAVICSEVLEHLWHPEKVNREAYRVLKKGGIYIVSTPNFAWIDHVMRGWGHLKYHPELYQHTKEHIRFYDVGTHTRMLKDAGFTVKDFQGADAQYGDFFLEARWQLKQAIPAYQDWEIDVLLGKMFRTECHTIGLVSVKK
jgi:ubiquinone/menaquinone biosynthesis C-methylase UbiE